MKRNKTLFSTDAVTFDRDRLCNSLHENDYSDIDEHESVNTSEAYCNTKLLERQNVGVVNQSSSMKRKRVLQSRSDNVPHVGSKKKCNCNNMLLELQIDKIKQNIEQQKELHEQRMKTAAAETKLAILRLLATEQELKDKNIV